LQVHLKNIIDHSNKVHDHDIYAWFRARLQDRYEKEVDFMLNKTIVMYEIISKVPVLLSMLVVALNVDEGEEAAVPRDMHDLYMSAIDKSVSRWSKANWNGIGADQMAELLRKLARANQERALAESGEVRTFSDSDVEKVLAPQEYKMWEGMLNSESLPLVKTLVVGEGGLFQFTHLSFQEALFGASLLKGEVDAFWKTTREATRQLNTAEFRNVFEIGEGHLGKELARRLPRLVIVEDLTPIGRESLGYMLAGAVQLGALEAHGKLGEGGVTAAILDPLCSVIQEQGNQLRTLKLGGNGNWQQEAAKKLLKALCSEACIVDETLDIEGIKLNDRETQDLLAARRALQILNVDGYPLPLEGLRGIKPTDTVILSGQGLGNSSACVIAACIAENRHLQRLRLNDNNIGDIGCTLVAKAMQQNTRCEINDLDLGSNEIGVAGAESLAALITASRSLTKINLSSNNLESEGGKAIAKGLLDSKNLLSIDLSSNNLKLEGVTAIAQAIRYSPLTAANLRANNLHDLQKSEIEREVELEGREDLVLEL